MKKLTALLLALIMVLAMNVAAFAEGETALNSGVAGSEDGNLTGISYNVTFESKNGVNKPGATFGYTIANGVAIAASSGKPAILAGVTGGATLTNPAAAFTTAAADGADTGKINIAFDATKFTQPGIYRYVISEDDNTLSEPMKAAGISKGDTYSTAYLDVYVAKEGSGFKVNAAVLNTDINTRNHITSTKIDGFRYYYTIDPGDITTPDPRDDTPESYDVKVSKTVDGAAASTDQGFAFTVTINAMPDATGVSFAGVQVPYQVYDSSDAAKTGENGTVTISATENQTANVTLKHGDYVKFTGLPKGATITAAEEPLDYTPSYAVTGMKTDSTDGKNSATDTVAASKLGVMAFKNTRTAISPTGVVLRVAPYAIMLGAGVVLFIILKSRKNKAVEEA